MKYTTEHYASAISPSARKQGDRAARKIAREFATHNLPTHRDGDISEELLAASYDEAADRGIYQSDYYMEQWWDWRSYVENRVIEELTATAT